MTNRCMSFWVFNEFINRLMLLDNQKINKIMFANHKINIFVEWLCLAEYFSSFQDFGIYKTWLKFWMRPFFAAFHRFLIFLAEVAYIIFNKTHFAEMILQWDMSCLGNILMLGFSRPKIYFDLLLEISMCL